MRAFVTGATGFLGSNLAVGLVERGVEVRILRRPTGGAEALQGARIEETTGDILDPPEKLARSMEGCEWVFHVAASVKYGRSPRELYRTNVEGTAHVAEAGLLAGVGRFVLTSSLSAMGVAEGGRLLDEDSEFSLSPSEFPYGHTKRLAEDEVRKRIDRGLSAVIVNPSTMFGPRDVRRNAGAMVIQAASGALRFYPQGGSNFVAVEDVVWGHIAAAEKGRVGQRYILGNRNLTYREVFERVCEVVGVPPPRWPIPNAILPVGAWGAQLLSWIRPGLLPVDPNQIRMSARCIYATSERAIRELGLPQSPLEGAIRRAHEWYQQNGYLRKS
ncbi:MAG: NAD-dependent epimerase/dehydratase family protein [Candidatus Omnitrophica bacterium]|nr:NAD-dependent epimerase/dehydratase family protein [Candidatus Omnitrophota bacterium]